MIKNKTKINICILFCKMLLSYKFLYFFALPKFPIRFSNTIIVLKSYRPTFNNYNKVSFVLIIEKQHLE